MTARRDILKAAAVSPLAMLAARTAPAGEPPEKWDLQADVIVAGSGIAGMAAAVSAAEKGAKVIVFEKGSYGGCAYISGGFLRLGGGTPAQVRYGVKDSPEDLYARLTDPKDPRMRKNIPELAKSYSETSPKCQEWLERQGVKFFDRPVKGIENQRLGSLQYVWWSDPGEAIPSPQPGGGYMSGKGIMEPLRTSFEGKGGELRLGFKVVSLFRDASGRVVGAKVAGPDGNPLSVAASKGVILAGGSWKADPALRRISDPRFTENLFSSGWPFVAPDGSAILAGLGAGALYAGGSGHDDAGQLRRKFGTSRYNWARGSKYGCPGINIGGKLWSELVITNRDGDRFFDELDPPAGSGYTFYDLALAQPDQKIWFVFDDETAKKARWELEPPVCEEGFAVSAPTVGELAELTGQSNLAATVERYNGFVERKADDDFHKAPERLARRISVAPFHAVRCVIGIHNLAGGIWVDGSCRALGAGGRPIPGLYAAGESSGGLLSAGMTRCLVTGRIAGESIAS